MRAFAQLFEALDGTTSTHDKVAAMAGYFRRAPPEDASWALYVLLGQRPKRLLGVRRLAEWAMQLTGVPAWLFDACYASTGDLAEAVALLLPVVPDERVSWPSLTELGTAIAALGQRDEAEQRAYVVGLWARLPPLGVFLAIKLMTGALRVGVSQILVTRALAEALSVEVAVLTDRLMGSASAGAPSAFRPGPDALAELGAPAGAADLSRPYPFALASPLEGEVEALGDRAAWQAEWKWDGIRCQVLRRAGQTWLWSRGEELVTDRFPELVEALRAVPDGTVVDGEVLAWSGEAPLPFAALQTRIGRKALTRAVMDAAPVALVIYDCLEDGGVDLRERPLAERRARVEAIVASAADPRVRASPVIAAAPLGESGWDALRALRATARERGVEGLMLKALDAPYVAGRHKGGMWKWKIEPHVVDAVLVYAQPGSGKRSNLYTDYTFAVWREDELVVVAKAYSGLDNAEIEALDTWIRRHTVEKFGPVRRVEPVHVFELGYEGIAASSRHKSGVALRFPRILRWRTDKPAAEADRLSTLEAQIEAQAARGESGGEGA